MASDASAFQIDHLTVSQRLELIQVLWESLPAQVEPSDVPAWHREILDQRLAEAAANPQDGVPWREVLAELDKRS